MLQDQAPSLLSYLRSCKKSEYLHFLITSFCLFSLLVPNVPMFHACYTQAMTKVSFEATILRLSAPVVLGLAE